MLRCRMDKMDRRQRGKAAGPQDGDMTSGDNTRTQQSQAGPGLSVGKDSSPQSDVVDGLSTLKEEVSPQDGAPIKHEQFGPRPNQESVSVTTSEENLSPGDQRQIDSMSATQAKTKPIALWDQSTRSADHRSLQDQPSSPFLSISQSGRCSPRADPSLVQPAEWLPGLDTTGSAVSSADMQTEGTSCSAPACSSSTSIDPSSFRPDFGSEEASNEDEDSSFPFLDPENTDQNPEQAQAVGLGEERQDQAQPQSGVSPWRPREGGRSSVNHIRRITNLANRDPLRLQSNSQLVTLRHLNSLGHPSAPGRGSERPYTCPYCTKCFTYPSHQRRHLLRHTGVRLHPCQFCDKSFLTSSELTVHTRTHTGERPFGCAQCGKRFARSGNLRAHQRDVHMGKRPFVCTECGKRFAHRGNLRVHNHRVHQGDPYYMDDQPEPDIAIPPNPI